MGHSGRPAFRSPSTYCAITESTNGTFRLTQSMLKVGCWRISPLKTSRASSNLPAWARLTQSARCAPWSPGRALRPSAVNRMASPYLPAEQWANPITAMNSGCCGSRGLRRIACSASAMASLSRPINAKARPKWLCAWADPGFNSMARRNAATDASRRLSTMAS